MLAGFNSSLGRASCLRRPAPSFAAARARNAALFLAALLTTATAWAVPATPAPTERDPLAIMNEVFRQGGAGAPRAGKLKLTIQAAGAEKRERLMNVRYKGDGTSRKALLLVEAPADMRGTGFVAVEYPGKKQEAERWIYLANLKRSSRIAGGQMSSSFLGSDLSFSDLSQSDPSGFDLKLIKESENVGGEDCWVVLAKAKDARLQAETGYAEVQAWISKSKFTMVRFKAPLLGSKAVKYMEASNFIKVGEQWAPKKLVIRTVEDGKVKSESVLETLELKSDSSVSDTDFTKQRLEAGV